MTDHEEYPTPPTPPYVLAAEATERIQRETQVLMDQTVTLPFGHIYSLLFGFVAEHERVIDYMTVSPGFAAFIKAMDPQALRVTVVDNQIWRTSAYKTSYKAYQMRKAAQAQRLEVVGEQHMVQTNLFKALRRANFSVAQAERLAKHASLNEETKKIVEELCHR